MNDNPDLKQLERKSFRYIEQDGLLEIFLGLTMIALSYTFLSPILFIVFIPLLYPSMKLLEKIKKSFTYPRTGYVRLRKQDVKPNHWTLQIFSLCITSTYCLLVYLTGDMSDLSNWGKWSPFLIGGIGSGVSLAAFRFSRVPKGFIYAVIGTGLGVYLSLVYSPETILHGAAIETLWYGVFMLLAGCFVLFRFLSKYRLQPDDDLNGQ